MGIDCLAHFGSGGWIYWQQDRQQIRRGHSDGHADRQSWARWSAVGWFGLSSSGARNRFELLQPIVAVLGSIVLSAGLSSYSQRSLATSRAELDWLRRKVNGEAITFLRKSNSTDLREKRATIKGLD